MMGNRSYFGTAKEDSNIEYFSDRRYTKHLTTNHLRNPVLQNNFEGSKDDLSDSSKLNHIYEQELNRFDVLDPSSEASKLPK